MLSGGNLVGNDKNSAYIDKKVSKYYTIKTMSL